jgi:DNA/RNA-binding domain of Phe-tRNA-synthetase-like protein
MEFSHSPELWHDFPGLVPGVLALDGVRPEAEPRLESFLAEARARLAERSEGEFAEIQAWRRAFTRMGLKPTQYRCASESLLRRLRKEGSLPRIHPLIDLCNAVSAAFAVPIAVFDRAKIEGDLQVRHADGSERYQAFSGETERPERHEVIFADAGGRAHARRWTNRQSGSSAVREETGSVLIVAEALHDTAAADVVRLVTTLAAELERAWSVTPAIAILASEASTFEG